MAYLAMAGTSIDDVLRALASRRRRRTCAFLAEQEAPVTTVDDIADHLRRAEREPGQGDVEVRLHHTDLPKLDDLGVVEFDPERGVVRYHGDPALERVLRAVDGLEPTAC